MIDDEFKVYFELLFTMSRACKTPPVEGAGAAFLPVPFPGGAKKEVEKKNIEWQPTSVRAPNVKNVRVHF
jgi:hypothetical protein